VPNRSRSFWRQLAWICRYTSLRPSDVMEMTLWQYEEFNEQLSEIVKLEAGRL
jgi:hypothetical protein